MKINYEDDMYFSVTFDNGTKSTSVKLPFDGTALVSTPDGKRMAVVALANHDGPLSPNTAYVLSAGSTQVTGTVPSDEEFAALEDDEENEGEDGMPDEDDDELEVIEGDEIEDDDDDAADDDLDEIE